MTTEQNAQQLELAAQILRTGHPWERELSIGKWSKTDSSLVTMISGGLKIRPILATPPDNRPLHNPDNLTAEEVGVGYRLALPEEMDGRFSNGKDDCDWWSVGHEWKRTDQVFPHNCPTDTIRLPLSTPWPSPKPDPYAELKKAHAEGKVIEVFIKDDEYGPDRWSKKESDGWPLPPEHYRIKPEPTFQLPQPPPAMQWHRTDVWQEGDLPQGMRPLVLDEANFPTDEIKRPYGWTTLNSLGDCTEIPTRPSTYPCRTRRTLTFTHADKKWTWHRPGDPMPCDGLDLVTTLLEDSKVGGTGIRAYRYDWGLRDDGEQIIGWRYADEKKTVPLGPEDVPPCCAFRLQNESSDYIMPTSVYAGGVYGHDEIVFRHTWEYLKEHYQINRSIPLTGKWNPDAWEPCHKLISENG